MIKEEVKEILDFIKEKKFVTRKTDGWSYLWCGEVVEVDEIKRKLTNMSRRKKSINKS